MIALIEPLPSGQAVRLFLYPPQGAADWRVLRRSTDTITGPDDAGAAVVAEWGRYEAVIDTDGLLDGQPYTYAVFYRDAAGAEITPRAPTRNASPAFTARDTSPDFLPLIRQRVQVALDAAVTAGVLSHPRGQVPIVIAPSIRRDEMPLPIVSVHLDSDRPAERGLADYFTDIELAALTGWDETTGWLSEVSVNIVGVALNPDQRNALGRVLKHAIIVNAPVWSAHNLLRPAVMLSHTEIAPEASGAPLYIASATFTFVIPSVSTAQRPEVLDAIALANTET